MHVSSVVAQGDAYTNLTIGRVPIDFPHACIEEALKGVGLILLEAQGSDRIKGLKDGRRIFKVMKKDLMKAKPSSFMCFGHIYKLIAECVGQKKTCHCCTESGHLVKDCRYKSRKPEVVNESWEKISGNRCSTSRVTFRQLIRHEEPEPSKEIFPDLPISTDAMNKSPFNTQEWK
ncbi:unnamed protein product [Clavelina lepadiformis]|uniref:CCHC-type domain-containing protein n=1 Tax=Clavelina lepadiformis TaxID=159417 RepID=A0ABP0F7Z7_CLALP